MESFDLRDTLAPFSMLQVVNHLPRMEAGDELEILGDDEETRTDLKTILPAAGCELVSEEEDSPSRGQFRIIFRKTGEAAMEQTSCEYRRPYGN